MIIGKQGPPVKENKLNGCIPGRCPNCGRDIRSVSALYCSQRCQQIAELIRNQRRKVAEGIYNRPDIAEARQIRAGLLIGGGYYDRQGRRESKKTKELLLRRARGRCERCGRQFSSDNEGRFTVQHTVSEDGVHLYAWCARCNNDDAIAKFRPIETKEERLTALELEIRIHSEFPLRVCDDEKNWISVFPKLRRASRLRWLEQHSRSLNDIREMVRINNNKKESRLNRADLPELTRKWLGSDQ